MKKKFKLILLLLLAMMSVIVSASSSYAATYTYYLGEFNDGPSGYYDSINTSVSSYNVTGYNQTHGIHQQIGGSITRSRKYSDGYIYYYYLNYVLPDDGCVWKVKGDVSFYQTSSTFDPNMGSNTQSSSAFFVNVDETRTTTGSFSGYSPKTATDTASTAATNATNAKTAADNAASYASTASTNASTAANNTTYSGYTAGYLAYYANSNASSANTNAANANTNASNAYNAVNNVNGNTVTAVRDGTGTALAEARLAKTNSLNAYNEAHTANTKIDSLQSTVTSIQNNLGGDTSPPVPKLRTVSGAVATSGGSIQVVLEVSDNVSSTFTYSLDGTIYNSLPVNRIISLPVSSPGPNVISVWVKDQAGNVGNTSITIRKL